MSIKNGVILAVSVAFTETAEPRVVCVLAFSGIAFFASHPSTHSIENIVDQCLYMECSKMKYLLVSAHERESAHWTNRSAFHPWFVKFRRLAVATASTTESVSRSLRISAFLADPPVEYDTTFQGSNRVQ